ncbi:LytTR family DNA-binding domain-containing protein [Porticoccaceae bacterium LTM1]|nr:LytTR family DNA-binding domain-containing protein [Porticoccaceae bacterium LTM1]
MKVLIVDDEPLARERLARMTGEIDNCQVVGQAGSGLEALEMARMVAPDVVLLDVRMPGMDGLSTATHFAEYDPPPAVIFCTAYDDYAVEAFSSQALGYLLKPVKMPDLESAICRARRLNKAQLEDLEQSPGFKHHRRAHVSSKNRRGVELVSIDNIRLFQADNKYVTAYHTEGEALLDETLKDLEDELNGQFVRIHRNALVSIPHIEGLERNQEGQYFVRLTDLDIRPQVSRRHVAQLRKLLETL